MTENPTQQGNFGIGIMSGGVIKGKAKVAGEIDENNHNQFQNTNIQFTVNNLTPQAESSISETSSNNNQNNKLLFEIKI